MSETDKESDLCEADSAQHKENQNDKYMIKVSKINNSYYNQI